MIHLSWARTFVLSLALIFNGVVAVAAPPSELLNALGVPRTLGDSNAWRHIQTDLAWIGLYHGLTTDTPDAKTIAAISRFRQSLGASVADRLTSEQRTELAERSQATQQGYRFAVQNLDWLGIRIELPEAILQRPEMYGDDNEILYFDTHHGASLDFRFRAFDNFNATPAQFLSGLLNALEKNDEDDELKILVSRSLSSSVYVIAELGEWRMVWIAQKQGQNWREMRLRHVATSTDAMRPLVHRVIRSLDFFAGPTLTRREQSERFRNRQDPVTSGYPEWFLTMVANGSGSVVSRDGHILTNNHVTEGCDRLTVNGAPAVALASDVRLDLSLIQSASVANRAPVRFRQANPQLGEAISVMGYPIFSTSPSMNYTRGYVSSVVGLRGDRTNVQITAPVQPGNSGGPVLDASGRQIAVVVSKLSAGFQVQRNTENVAFVIRGRQAVEFLQRHGIRPIIEERPARISTPTTDDVARWRQVTVRIECHRDPIR